MRKLILIVGGSTLLYAALALIMGVLPGITLSHVSPGPGVAPLTKQQLRGREVYVANGCSYCHTQQVRPLAEDRIFGRPSARGDFAYQTPELLGSERTGPDLTNVGARQPSSVWQFIHLYNPRAVVPESIMPSFAWLFKVRDQAPAGTTVVPVPPPFAPPHGVVVPSQDAEALVAYLLALKQPELPKSADAAVATASTASDAAAQNTPSAPGGAAYDLAKGQALFITNCAACHQATGAGLPGAFPPLKGDPVVNDTDPTRHIHVVLNGLHGMSVGGTVYPSTMPPFKTVLSDADVANIIDYERTAWGNHGSPVTPALVAAQRATGE
jgi:cytochrome c oxidase cbb3-type subunit II